MRLPAAPHHPRVHGALARGFAFNHDFSTSAQPRQPRSGKLLAASASEMWITWLAMGAIIPSFLLFSSFSIKSSGQFSGTVNRSSNSNSQIYNLDSEGVGMEPTIGPEPISRSLGVIATRKGLPATACELSSVYKPKATVYKLLLGSKP
jgi:hypothetical protein